ncbi:BMT4 [Candida oxycetoniae]|uniref:BMT4 n=1 Tax=Candida oxycetoniae TaxID=497107 RepID=A0AAI9SZX0_9ASCO|nr:BMT4 [Candida oxycetoniae]KAI3405656.2 BMT4 [Candida oxycetoniae]
MFIVTMAIDTLPHYQRLLESEKQAPFPLSDSFLENTEFDSISLRTFTDPYPLIVGKPQTYAFEANFMCSELEFEDTFEKSSQVYLNADFEYFLMKLNEIKEYSKLLTQARKRFKPTIPEKHQWFRFGGSSVWLPNLGVHYMVSRVLYSPSGIPNKAYVSFLYIQIFDQNWKELPKGTKFTIPFEERKTLYHTNIDGTFQTYQSDPKLNFKVVEYPQVLPIPIDYSLHTSSGKYYYGPEDPRIILRSNPFGFDEPLIVFNMKDLKLAKRTMFRYLPFSNNLQVFRKRNEPYAYIEKNWTPFLTPLPLANLPAAIINQLNIPSNRQVYLGWARAHLNNCGCGESMYRPNMVLLVEDYDKESDKFYYKMGDVSSYFDFGAHVPPWSDHSQVDQGTGDEASIENLQCHGRNVLIPNSIAYWEISSVSKNDKTYYHFKDLTVSSADALLFNDYMGVTLSGADQDVSIVHLRGLLNYVIKLPSLFDEETVVSSNDGLLLRGSDWNNKCAMYSSKEFCKEYGLRYGGGNTD